MASHHSSEQAEPSSESVSENAVYVGLISAYPANPSYRISIPSEVFDFTAAEIGMDTWCVFKTDADRLRYHMGTMEPAMIEGLYQGSYRIQDTGTSAVLTVPKDLIRHDLVPVSKDIPLYWLPGQEILEYRPAEDNPYCQ